MPSQGIYTIGSLKSEKESMEAIVTFNQKHPVFEGHFAGNPIVPGVVQIQIIKSLLELKMGKSLVLVQAKNIKFLSIISPDKYPKVEVAIRAKVFENDLIKVHATLQSGEITFMKFDGTFKQAS